MKHNPEELKLIYVLKIGYNSKNEGLYEFIFSKDPETIDYENWSWDKTPACDNAIPPTDEFYDEIYSLKTQNFDLFCLHEAVDRPYLHGYYNIHCLAFEDPDSDNNVDGDYDDYEDMFNNGYKESNKHNDQKILVFHYRMTLQDVEDLLYEKDIILKGREFTTTKNINII